jgi:prevent-host-death family protein
LSAVGARKEPTVATVTIEDAQIHLKELIERLSPGEEVVITENDQPVAKLVSSRRARKPRRPGNCKGMLTIVSDDDEHLKDFAEYMP